MTNVTAQALCQEEYYPQNGWNGRQSPDEHKYSLGSSLCVIISYGAVVYWYGSPVYKLCLQDPRDPGRSYDYLR